jgi:ABC-2 type transport system permease protein/oleandomycin transport system permease protein
MTTLTAPTVATTPVPERRRLTLAETWADSRVMAARQIRKTLRRPVFLTFVLVQPVMFLLLFRYVFGGAIDTGGVAYIDFLLPGIVVQSAIFGALMTGMGLTEDLKAGVVDRFRSLPMARSAVLVGRTGADVLMNVVTLLVMIGVGIAIGFRPREPVGDLVLALGLILAFAYVFSWISAFIGLSVKDPETAQSAGFMWVIPLTFASSAFVPAESMPGIVRTFAEINPMTLTVDAARALMIGHGDAGGPALGALAWLVALLVVFVPLSVRAFRRA